MAIPMGIDDGFSCVITYRGEIITGHVCSYSITHSYSNDSFDVVDISVSLYPERQAEGGIIIPQTIQQASTDVLLNESFKRIKERLK